MSKAKEPDFNSVQVDGHTLFNVHDYSVQKVKKIENIIWLNGDYWGKSVYNGEKSFNFRFPKISARPSVQAENYRHYKKRNFWTRMPELRIKVMPKLLHFRTIVNWSYERYGSPQIAVKGAKNQAKSNMINLLTAIKLARQKRVIMYCDLNLEAKHLAPHGYYKKGVFMPFPMEILIPKDYKFKFVEFPIWEHYDNVSLGYYENADDIVDSTRPGKLTVIYSDCYDQKALVRLTYDLVKIIAEQVSRFKSFYLVHHELHKLFKQLQSKGTSKLMDRLADEFADFRKHNIGLIAGYHLGSEVHYRFAQKFTIIINKSPPNRPTLTPAEKDAKNYTINEFNIEIAGYYRKHEYSYFPELPRWVFRLIPQRKKLAYPSFDLIDELEEENKMPMIKKVYLEMYNDHLKGDSFGDISKKYGVSSATAHKAFKEIETILD